MGDLTFANEHGDQRTSDGAVPIEGDDSPYGHACDCHVKEQHANLFSSSPHEMMSSADREDNSRRSRRGSGRLRVHLGDMGPSWGLRGRGPLLDLGVSIIWDCWGGATYVGLG